MPSAQPLPTVPELEQAFHAAVGSERKTEDAHLGSIYDRMSGIGALTMRRIAERDQSEARAIFFDTATDDKLDSYIEQRFGASRDQDAPGSGVAQFSRSSGVAGKFLKGTRIAVGRGGSEAPRYWLVSADTSVGTDVLASVPIVAGVNGPAGQISLSAGQVSVFGLADPLWDNSWQLTQLDCAPGTVRQTDPTVRATIRQARFDARPGFETAILNAMVAAGASVVAMYASDFLSPTVPDVGLNRIYVGDGSYSSPLALLNACRLAIPGVAVAGTSVQVLPMRDALFFVRAAVKLWATPERFNQIQAQADAAASVVEYFARRDNAFLWSAAAIRAAVMKAVPNVHSVTVTAFTDSGMVTPVVEPAVATLFDVSPLPRYRVTDSTVSVTLAGPT